MTPNREQSRAALDKITAAKGNPDQLQQALEAARASSSLDQATLDKITAAKGNPDQLQQVLTEARTKAEAGGKQQVPAGQDPDTQS
jgi:hypothetical protein